MNVAVCGGVRDCQMWGSLFVIDANSRGARCSILSSQQQSPQHLIFRISFTMSNEDQSIRGLFFKAERAREELGASYEPNSPTYQENLSNTIATYIQCLKKAEDFSLFSPNETSEDISSTDIQ